MDPSLGHALITSLSVHQLPKSQRSLVNNEALQLLYLDIASECVKRIRKAHARAESNKGEVGTYDSQGECSQLSATEAMPLTQDKAEKLRELVYQMLSLVNPNPEMTRVMKKIVRLFEHLLLPFNTGAEPDFSLEAIYCCLIARPSCLLARKLQEVEKMLKASGATIGTLQEMDIVEADRWKPVFYALYHKHEHFLESIMVSSVLQTFSHSVLL